MNKPVMDLRALVEKSTDAALLREMVDACRRREAAERLMELEVGAKAGADYEEKSPDRLAQRNGYRDRDRDREWQTRAGSVEMRIPRPRAGSYFPSFLEPRRAVETAPTAGIQEASVQGVSTHAMDDLAQALGGTGVSESQVNRPLVEIDEWGDAFLTPPIERG